MNENRLFSRRRLLFGASALAALPVLSACGKRGKVRLSPEDQDQATYPQSYPPPDSVNPGPVPRSGRTAPAPEPEASDDGNYVDPYREAFPDDNEETVQ